MAVARLITPLTLALLVMAIAGAGLARADAPQAGESRAAADDQPLVHPYSHGPVPWAIADRPRLPQLDPPFHIRPLRASTRRPADAPAADAARPRGPQLLERARAQARYDVARARGHLGSPRAPLAHPHHPVWVPDRPAVRTSPFSDQRYHLHRGSLHWKHAYFYPVERTTFGYRQPKHWNRAIPEHRSTLPHRSEQRRHRSPRD